MVFLLLFGLVLVVEGFCWLVEVFSQIADWTLLFCFWFSFNALICLLFSQKIPRVLTKLSHVAKTFLKLLF